MIVEELIPVGEFPNGAVGFSWLIIGKRPAFDLPPKKVIQVDDFLDLAGINVPFVETTRAIPAGACIKKADLKIVQHVYFTVVPPLPARPTNISAVVGKKARENLDEDREITNKDIIP